MQHINIDSKLRRWLFLQIDREIRTWLMCVFFLILIFLNKDEDMF